MLQEGEDGILSNPDDPSEMADLFSKLLMDSELRDRIGAAGLARSSKFSIELMATSLTDIYHSLLENPPKDSPRKRLMLQTEVALGRKK